MISSFRQRHSTIGWFTTGFPVQLEIEPSRRPGDALKSVKEQLRQVPHRGIGYGILRYLSLDAEIRSNLEALPSAEISFNYLGQSDGLFGDSLVLASASESAGPTRGSLGRRRHLLEVNSAVSAGKLQLTWTYSQNIHSRDTIERLAQAYIQALQDLIQHCLSPEAGGYTPSDLPAARLSQRQLDQLMTGLTTPIEDIYELSPMQQGMLFHTLSEPDSGIYFEQPNFTIRGELNVVAFKQAWRQVVNRYPVLRTYFDWQSLDKPVQVVSQTLELSWDERNWRHLSSTEQAERLKIFLQQDRQQGFELDQAPLMRFALIQLAPDTHHFIWSFHHLLTDGWSGPILFSEVFNFYAAFNQGEVLSLPRPLPYRDYIAWLQQQDLDQAEAFWRQTLQGFSAPTPLASDHPSKNRTHAPGLYREYDVQLSAEATAALKSLAKHSQLTLNTLIQGAWALLLNRCSGESDVVFGTTVSGRSISDISGIESMVGLFINTLPLRVQVTPDTQLLPWLQALQTQQIEQEEYAYTPLFQIQQWSDAPGGINLFDSLVIFENYPTDAFGAVMQESALSIANFSNLEQTNYPLTLTVISRQELSFLISYDTSHFESETIQRLAGHLQTLLAGMVATPNQLLTDLPLLTPSERDQLLVIKCQLLWRIASIILAG